MENPQVPMHVRQWQRVERWLARFEKCQNGKLTSMPGSFSIADSEDYAHAFFQNCYHLKDWLKNDHQFTAKSNDEIEQYITDTPSLAICADICNGSKHLMLIRPRSGATPEIGNTLTIRFDWDTITKGIEQGIIPPNSYRAAVKPVIEHNGNNLSAIDVAKQAVEAWRRFIGEPA